MSRSWPRLAAMAIVLPALLPPASADDLYREPVCLGSRGESDQDRMLVKVLRWPYALEQPFHVLPDDPSGGKRKLDASLRMPVHNHGGAILEGPSSTPWNAEVELQAGFSRGPVPGSPLCEDDVGFAIPDARITTDPYTGNLFVGRFEDDRLHLAVFDRPGELLVDIRSDLFFRSALPDLSGTPPAEIDATEYFWFDSDRLAGFVDVYRRIGGASYARFLVDAFLSELIYRDRTGDDETAGPRLPYLPGPDASPHALMPGEVDNLRGLRTTYRQVFIRGRPRKGGVSCALMPVLKMIEDRDCRAAAEAEAGASLAEGSCPTYSAMALQTELFRNYPETMRRRGYAFYQVFETLVDRGLCPEADYPMLTDIAIGRTRSVEQFGERAERELNRALEERDHVPNESLREFLDRTPAGPLRFVEQLPPRCREAMAAYRVTHPLAVHDLVDLLAGQDWFDDALPEDSTAELLRAQKDELFRLVVRLLRGGLLVGVAGDQGRLELHAVLAYGWNADGFLLMDSDLPEEADRRKTVLPADELRRSLAGVSFLRDEVASQPPSAAQLEASLTVAPDIAWTHAWLGKLYREQGRQRDALKPLRRVTELRPGRADGWLDLGEALQDLGMFEEALEATREAIAVGGDNPYASAQLGYSLRKLGRLEEAERALRESVNAEHSWEWRQLGWTLFDLGKDDEAEECFRKAVAISPEILWNHLQLAEFLTYAGKPEAARQVLLAAARLDFDAADRTWIGNWLGVLGRFDEAIPMLESVLEEDPGISDARLALARVYRRQGETAKSASIVAPLIAADASDPDSRIDRAYAQALAGDATACRETVGRLQAENPQMEGAELYDLACVQALNGDRKQALDSLESAFLRGFDDYRWARHDPDLATLQGDPGLERIFARHGSHER